MIAMQIDIHLYDRDGEKEATLHAVPESSVKAKVVLYKGNYYAFYDMELVGNVLRMAYTLTDIVEVKV